MRVRRRSVNIIRERRIQADPVSVQLGVGLTRSAPLLVEELIQIEHGVSL